MLPRVVLLSLLLATTEGSGISDSFHRVLESRRRLTQCEMSCDVVPDEILTFCAPIIQYSVCQTASSWETMDAKLPRAMKSLGIHTVAVMLAASKNDACAAGILNLHCKHIFPACEIGTEVLPLCADACAEVLQACEGSAKFTLPPTMCEDMSDLSSDAQCVDLEYEGADGLLWIAGFSMGLVFSVTATLGMNLQKLSMNREALKPKGERSLAFKQTLWLTGMSIIASGTLLDFAAFGMAPQSLLAPLGALSLVWNLLLAPYFNSEKLTRQTLNATGVICFGTLLTVIFAAHSSPTYTLKDLASLYKKPVMICYIVSVVIFLATMAITLKKIEDSIPSDEEEDVNLEDKSLVEDTGTGLPITPATPSQCKKRKNSTYTEMHRIVCYGGLAGCFGGQSVLFAKSTSELVKNLFDGSESGAFYHPQPYLIIICMAVCLLSQITILNAGLSKFNALLMVPVYQSFWIIFSVLGGIIYFQEYRAMHVYSTIFFLAGIFITLAGVFYLLRERVDGIDAQWVEEVHDDDYTPFLGTASPEENPNEARGLERLSEKLLIDDAEKMARTTNL